MRVLVTGANGLVGSCVVRRLASGNEVVATGRGAPRATPNRDVEYVEIDLRSRAGELERLAADGRFAAVVHAAAMTDVDGCERDPVAAHAINHDATAAVARGCRASGAHLVAFSTDYVFDGERGPYTETDLPNPRSVYGRTKRMGEEAALLLAPEALVVRVSAVFSGRGDVKSTFPRSVVESLRAGRPVKAFQDQVVSPTHADSAAAAAVDLSTKRVGGVVHWAGAFALSRYEFALAIADALGADRALVVPTRVTDLNLPAARPKNSALRTDGPLASLVGSARPLSAREAIDLLLAETGRLQPA
jgi:dTDP-4-dehydrorhamnose reductase